MAASIRTIQTLSSTGGQAWSVARSTTTTAAAAAAVNPGTTHGHLNLYSNPNNTNNNNTDAATTTTTASSGNATTASPIAPASALNSTNSPTTSATNSTLTLSTGPTCTTSVGNSPVTGPAVPPFTASRGAINQAQSINSHNQYIYNHHLQLSHNHHLQQQQQQQRRQLQLQSQAHGQAQRNQVQGQRQHHPQQQQNHHQQQQQQQQRIPHPQQQAQQYNQHQHQQRTPSQPQTHQFQPYNQHQQFFNNANPYSGRASQGYNGNINRNMSSIHRAPLHYRSASPPSGASSANAAGSPGSVIQAQAAQVSSNPFRVQLPHQGGGGAQGNRKSPPPVPATNRRRSALPQLPIPLPSQVMQQNAGVSASPPPFASSSSLTVNSITPTITNTSTTASSTSRMIAPATKTAIRFDPFADEADSLEGVASSFSASPSPFYSGSSSYANANVNSYNPTSNVPYTIQIPAAGTHEIQQYALRSKLTYEPARPSSSALGSGGENRSNGLGGHRLNGPRRSPSPPNPIARPTSPPKTGASIEGAPTPQTSPTRTEMGVNPFDRISVQSSVSSPSRSPSPPSDSASSCSSSASRSPSPPTVTSSGTRSSGRPQPTPNLSKLVAGILLNRVYAVGKPMRRHPSLSAGGSGKGCGVGEEGYVKSALRWEVGV